MVKRHKEWDRLVRAERDALAAAAASEGPENNCGSMAEPARQQQQDLAFVSTALMPL